MGQAATIHLRLRSLTVSVPAYVRRHPRLETAAIVALSGLVFGIGFTLSMKTFQVDELAVCWPLVGLETAALLRISRRHWPAAFCGMIISQLILERSRPVDEMAVDTICDVIEVLIAVFSLPALGELSEWIRQPRLLQRFIAGPMILGPALTAFPVAAIYARGLHVSFWGHWSFWALGDGLGMVLWLPLGVVLMSRETYSLFTLKALPRTVGLMGMLGCAGWSIFLFKPTHLAFVVMPLLLFIALKLGFSGSVIAVNLLGAIASEGTLHHLGPFGVIPEPYNVTMLQGYLAISMLMCFPISIVLLERDTFEGEIKNAYARMEQLAISDALTGLANRRRFDAVFEEEWRRALRDGDPLAVLMIDVDCFKLFNDLYGHLAGDECLRRIADSIRGSVKRAGDLAARFGGEEFIVLMPRTDLSGALETAEMLRSGIESLQLEHTGNPYRVVTVSIGCWSIVPDCDVLPMTLIETADQGLYAAKQGGRNGIGTVQPKEQYVASFQAS